MSAYDAIIARKAYARTFGGVKHGPLGTHLFPHQDALTSWALRKGRAAIFADTGLGKTAIELEWATQVAERHGRVLILAPLAVAEQIVREGVRWNRPCTYLREDDGATPIVVTNYEMLAHFDPRAFSGVVLDESSILKNFNGRTRDALIEAFSETPFRLAATATPAPNDTAELGNHSEFLGIKTRSEMLAEYFVHDGETTREWRVKGHAQDAFWRWVCSWGAVVKTPADLGFDGSAFVLPPLTIEEVIVPIDHRDTWSTGHLFAPQAMTLNEQRAVRRATTEKRAAIVAAIAARSDEPLIVWGELNDECDAIEEAIPGSMQVRGADSPEDKRKNLLGFADGAFKVLVSKSSIAGFGMNWQHCARMVFVGVSHSYEQTYQSIRRCWRFGQTRPVHAYVLRTENEEAIVANYRRKEADAARFAAEMTVRVRDLVRAEVAGSTSREWNPYKPRTAMTVPHWIGAE